MSEHVLDKYFRTYTKQTLCPGCGNGIVYNAAVHAMEACGLNQDKVVVISGVGCSSRSSIFIDSCGLHVNHGRPLGFAMGVKMANPELKVFVITGDGDATAIGGNHFIHACRRNIDITMIVCNNNNYGMTGGQFSPTTPTDAITKTTTFGNIDPPFDICKLAMGAGATYVARSTTYHIVDLQNKIKEAITHRGFSVVDALSDCPSLFGRLNKLGSAPEMMLRRKDQCVTIAQAEKLSKEEIKGKIVIGKFFEDNSRPEYTQCYAELLKRVKEA